MRGFPQTRYCRSHSEEHSITRGLNVLTRTQLNDGSWNDSSDAGPSAQDPYMKKFAKFYEVPLSDIQPEGWLRVYLEKQRDGLTGHLEAAGFPFDTPGWAAPRVAHHARYSGWWPYEQTGYWVDGIIRCGHLLRDEFLTAKALRSIDYVLENADEDGYLGPDFMKDPADNNRWPHAVFFRALMAHESAARDARVVPALLKHYLSGTAPHTFWRNVCNVEVVLWAYERSGDRLLLEHAIQAFQGYNELFPEADAAMANLLKDKPASEHGVTYNETAKLGAILYSYTGDEDYLEASIHAYQKIDKYHMLVDGVCSSTEKLTTTDPLDSHETCDIADYTWSVGYLLMATGLAEYADKVERACFNAAPGAVRSDFKGLQYFSCPNQVIADASSNHNRMYRGFPWMSYRPNPGTECCPGEVNRIMPNFAARMWMSDGEGGVVAALYGPGRLTTGVGPDAQKVTIVQQTDYPFSEQINFLIQTEAPVEFTLWLRVPEWCTRPSLEINGQPVELELEPGRFFPLRRKFAAGDRIRLHLPMELAIQRWPLDGISVERGPLVYALKIEEDWQIDPAEERATPDFPAWNLYPRSDWNYALALDLENFKDEIEIIHHPVGRDPWRLEAAPLELRVPARQIRDWEIERFETIESQYWGADGFRANEKQGEFAFTPQLPDPETLPERLEETVEMVTLVPYGCTHLRVTIFPHASG